MCWWVYNLTRFLNFFRLDLGSVPRVKYFLLVILIHIDAWVIYNISLEMPVPSQGHYGFHSFPVVD